MKRAENPHLAPESYIWEQGADARLKDCIDDLRARAEEYAEIDSRFATLLARIMSDIADEWGKEKP